MPDQSGQEDQLTIDQEIIVDSLIVLCDRTMTVSEQTQKLMNIHMVMCE